MQVKNRIRRRRRPFYTPTYFPQATLMKTKFYNNKPSSSSMLKTIASGPLSACVPGGPAWELGRKCPVCQEWLRLMYTLLAIWRKTLVNSDLGKVVQNSPAHADGWREKICFLYFPSFISPTCFGCFYHIKVGKVQRRQNLSLVMYACFWVWAWCTKKRILVFLKTREHGLSSCIIKI